MSINLYFCNLIWNANKSTMDLQRINKHKQSFDDICHYIEDDNGADKVEVWFARELQIILGYARWENFQVALTRAVESCKTQNINIDDHFREVTKMIWVQAREGFTTAARRSLSAPFAAGQPVFYATIRRWATYTAIRKPGCSCPTQRAPRPRDTARPAPA